MQGLQVQGFLSRHILGFYGLGSSWAGVPMKGCTLSKPAIFSRFGMRWLCLHFGCFVLYDSGSPGDGKFLKVFL